MEYMENLTEYVEKQASLCQQHDVIDKELYARYGVKRGLRDENGQGVLTGLTNISQIIAFKDVDGQKVPCDGQLLYRGYDVQDLVNAIYLRKLLIFFSSENCLPRLSSQNSAVSSPSP